jgi:hypothetical protein
MDGDNKLMTLSEEQCAQLYKQVIETKTDFAWIKERLEKGDALLECMDKRILELEQNQSIREGQSLMKGKLGAFILGIAVILTLITNGIIWVFSYFGGKS